MNIYYIQEKDNRILLKDIWEGYYWMLSDKNGWIDNLKLINYFKNFFEIITKFMIYSNLIKMFVVHKTKYDRATIFDPYNYFNWLNKYPGFNNIILQYNQLVIDDFNLILNRL